MGNAIISAALAAVFLTLMSCMIEPLPVAARDYLAPRAVGTLRRWIASTRPHILHAHRGTDLWLLRQAALAPRPASTAGRSPAG